MCILSFGFSLNVHFFPQTQAILVPYKKLTATVTKQAKLLATSIMVPPRLADNPADSRG